jgi:hypothetical protein
VLLALCFDHYWGNRMSNLKRFEMEETGVLHLRDAGDELMYAEGEDGAPDLAKPMRIYLYGPGSKQYAKALAARDNRWIERMKRRGKVAQSAEEKVRDQAELLTACTQSFENLDTGSGATGEALYLEVYTSLKLSFISTQANAFLNETANFTKGSTSTSASTSGPSPG